MLMLLLLSLIGFIKRFLTLLALALLLGLFLALVSYLRL
ncbi:hypothetical protein VO64_0308 [Pseudomonas synxantha]|uniref:Uncharacterized protein n=1 Tax=Pseudomonas synxantha TaxID=47883 RepID=A0AAU8TE87_9PSED|nr:hypothetical protein VO64_0296 [Pseudomonas synxantha]AKA80854.1 hypothetical protein VO64_0308 [Pseudomonas synxantha]